MRDLVQSHQLEKPKLSTFKESILKMLGEEGVELWNLNLKENNLSPDHTGELTPEQMELLIQKFIDKGDLISIVARSFMIRLKSYQFLSQSQQGE